MSRILKWTVPVDDNEHLIGPGHVVHVGQQEGAYLNQPGDTIQVWTIEPDEPRGFGRPALVVATGQHFDEDRWKHVGTVVGPVFVWHVLRRRR